MSIRYRSGKNNANADGLSRRPSSEETIKASHIISASNIAEDDGLVLMNSITYLGDVEELKREQASDEFTSANIIRTLKEGKQLSCELERWHKFMIINGVLCRQSRKSSTKPRTLIVVPQSLRKFIFDQLHVKSGHFGIHKTFEKISERFSLFRGGYTP